MAEFMSINHIIYSYPAKNDKIPVLDNLSFVIKEEEILAIVGPKGCGKSTLLSVIAGLTKPDWGEIILNKELTTSYGQTIGYLPEKSEIDRCILKNERLNTYCLLTFKNPDNSYISGNIWQRASMIRSLLLESDLLLLDEPFSYFDTPTKSAIFNNIKQIIRKDKKTAVFTTGSLKEALTIADRVILLSPCPCTVEDILVL